jgi:ribonuclease J
MIKKVTPLSSTKPRPRPTNPNQGGRMASRRPARPPRGPAQLPTRMTEQEPLNAARYTLSRDTLRVIPLGGVEEVGANMTAFEYGDDIIVVDMGFAFPDETTPGIDYIIPNTQWLEENKKRIRGVFITHGHLDHIGAVPYILPKIGDPPVYTMQLTAGFVKKRLEEFNLHNRTRLNVIKVDDVVPLGNFKVRFFGVNHNIPDSIGLSILTPIGQIIHTGDWKIDHTPINERPMEFAKLARFGGEGVILLLGESTSALVPGYCLSEREIGVSIDRIFQDAKQRIIFSSFSSLIPRMQQVFDIATKYNRKVVVTGRSMVANVEIALSLGYLKIQPKQIIKSEQAKKYPDNQIVIMTTGAQGEEFSALARMSRGEHKLVTIKKGDTVVVSASQIPGNERSIVAVLDNITRLGAEVIYNKVYDIHTSGHAHQEELKLMLNLVKPKYLIPIHGEHHMLVAHKKLAMSIGMKDENVFVLENYQALEINANGIAKVTEKLPGGHAFVDGLGVGDVGEVVIRDRKVMAEDGMFVIIVTLDRASGKLISQPDILSRGFIYMKNNDELIREVKHEVRKMTEGQSQSKQKLEPNFAYLRQAIRDQVGEYLFSKTQRRPMILPVIIEV